MSCAPMFLYFQVASRSCLIVTGVILMVVSIFGKLGAFMSTMPDPVVGGSMFITFGLISAVGIFNLRAIDLTSSRNLAVFGMSLYCGIVMPEWLSRYPDGIDLGMFLSINTVALLIHQSQLACGGFASCLRRITRHFRSGSQGTPCDFRVIYGNRAGIELLLTRT